MDQKSPISPLGTEVPHHVRPSISLEDVDLAESHHLATPFLPLEPIAWPYTRGSAHIRPSSSSYSATVAPSFREDNRFSFDRTTSSLELGRAPVSNEHLPHQRQETCDDQYECKSTSTDKVEYVALHRPCDDQQSKGDSKSRRRCGKAHCPSIFTQRDYWIVECVAWLLSLLLLVATVVTLAAFDKKPLEAWSSNVSLNAIVSTLVTLLYLFVMVPISASLAQLKWNLFTKARRLYDFEIFERASKTPFGSLMLLLRAPKSILAILAACLTIAIAAVGPFIQLVISTQTLFFDDGNATIPFGAGFGHKSDVYTQTIDLPIKAAFYNGLFASEPLNLPANQTCAPSNNCTWPVYQSLIVHKECSDITHLLANETGNGITQRVALPNGHSLDTDGVVGTTPFSIAANILESIEFKDRGYVLVDFTTISLKTSQSPAPRSAFECILQLAVQEFKADYIDGVFRETAVGPPITDNSALALLANPWLQGKNLTGEEKGKLFYGPSGGWLTFTQPDPLSDVIRVSIADSFEFAKFLSDQLTGKVSVEFDPLNGETVIDATSDGVQAIYQAISQLSPVSTVDNASSIDLLAVMDNVATTLTQALRSPAQPDSHVKQVSTSQHQAILAYKIRWSWITLPAVLVGLVALLLLMTIVETRRRKLPVYVDSVIAATVHGLGDERSRARLASLTAVHELDTVARQIIVRWDDEKRQLVQV